MMTTENVIDPDSKGSKTLQLTLMPTRKNTQWQEVVLGEGEHSVGSDHRSDVVLDVAGVASLHCTISIDASTARVTSFDSHTWVNEGPVKNTRLRHNDTLLLGPVEYRIIIDSIDSNLAVLNESAPAKSVSEPVQTPSLHEEHPLLKALTVAIQQGKLPAQAEDLLHSLSPSEIQSLNSASPQKPADLQQDLVTANTETKQGIHTQQQFLQNSLGTIGNNPGNSPAATQQDLTAEIILEERLQDLRNREMMFRQQMSDFEYRQEELNQQRERIQKLWDSKKEDLEQLRKTLELQQQAQKSKADDLLNLKKDIDAQEDKLQERITELDNKEKSLDDRIAAQEEKELEFTSTQASFLSQTDAFNQSQLDFEQGVKQLEDDRQQLENEFSELTKEKAEFEKFVVTEKEKLQEQESALVETGKHWETKLEELASKEEELTTKSAELEAKIAQHQVKADEIEALSVELDNKEAMLKEQENLLENRTETYEQHIAELEAKQQSLSEQESLLNEKQEQLERDAEDLDLKKQDIDSQAQYNTDHEFEVLKLQGQLESKQQEADELTNSKEEVQAKQAQLEELEQTLKAKENELTLREQSVSELDSALCEKENMLKEREESLNDPQSEIANLNETVVDKNELLQEIDSLKEILATKDEEFSTLQAKLDTLAGELDEAKLTADQQKTDDDNLKAELQAKESTLKDKEVQLEEKEREINDQHCSIKTKEQELQDLESKLEEHKKQLADEESNYQQREKTLSQLEEILAEKESHLAKQESNLFEQQMAFEEKLLQSNDTDSIDTELENSEHEDAQASTENDANDSGFDGSQSLFEDDELDSAETQSGADNKGSDIYQGLLTTGEEAKQEDSNLEPEAEENISTLPDEIENTTPSKIHDGDTALHLEHDTEEMHLSVQDLKRPEEADTLHEQVTSEDHKPTDDHDLEDELKQDEAPVLKDELETGNDQQLDTDPAETTQQRDIIFNDLDATEDETVSTNLETPSTEHENYVPPVSAGIELSSTMESVPILNQDTDVEINEKRETTDGSTASTPDNADEDAESLALREELSKMFGFNLSSPSDSTHKETDTSTDTDLVAETDTADGTEDEVTQAEDSGMIVFGKKETSTSSEEVDLEETTPQSTDIFSPENSQEVVSEEIVDETPEETSEVENDAEAQEKPEYTPPSFLNWKPGDEEEENSLENEMGSASIDDENSSQNITEETTATSTEESFDDATNDNVEEGDDSISKYMERLLAQSRGWQTPEDKPEKEESSSFSSASNVPSQTQKKPTDVLEPDEQEEVEEVAPKLPRSQEEKDEERKKMLEFRAVANKSARTAIAKYNFQKLRTKISVDYVLIVTSIFVTTALGLSHLWSKESYTIYAIVSAIIGLFAFVELVRAKKLLKSLTDKANEGEH